MDIGTIDYFANSGRSFLHRTSTVYKIIFAALVLTSVVVSYDLTFLLSIYLILTALVILTGLPFLKIMLIASYPAIFALLFIAASWNGSWMSSGVILLKALDAALTMVILIVTTPYPSVFAALSPLLPKVVGEGLFLTYRAIFILLELMDNLICALRIRGGFSPGRHLRNVSNAASGIGLLLIHGFDLSERVYGVMKIRGYSGRIADDERRGFSQRDLSLIALGVLIFLFSLGIRFQEGVRDYEAYALIVSLLFISFAAFYRHFNKYRGVD